MLKFDKNGRFRVMHITDSHIKKENAEASLFLIDESLKREKPDIVIVTGDNVLNYNDVSVTKGYIERLMKIFQKHSSRVAVTFGNHDSETGALSREELMLIYSDYPCHVCGCDEKSLSQVQRIMFRFFHPTVNLLFLICGYSIRETMIKTDITGV